MKYPDSHWEEVAKRFKEAPVPEGTKRTQDMKLRISYIQNHYPHVTEGTVGTWVAKCRGKGLL